MFTIPGVKSLGAEVIADKSGGRPSNGLTGLDHRQIPFIVLSTTLVILGIEKHVALPPRY